MNLLSYLTVWLAGGTCTNGIILTHSDNDRELELLLRASEAVFIIECIVLKMVCMVD